MKKKGFTLIELLAVLVILGVLITLAVSAVSRYIGNGKKAYYQGLEKNIKVAAQDYYADFKTLLPRKVGDVTTVSLQMLIDNNYIDPVLDESKNRCYEDGESSSNKSLVIVEKIDKNKYKYSVCLVCNKYTTKDVCDNISSEGKLIEYTIELNSELSSSIGQCDSRNIPTATVTRTDIDNGTFTEKKVIINKNLSPSLDKEKLYSVGDVAVKWNYGFKHVVRNIQIVDTTAPSDPVVSLRYLNGSNYEATVNGTDDVIITNQDLTMEVKSSDYECMVDDKKVSGSGINKIVYDDGVRDSKTILTSSNITKTNLSDTLFGNVNLAVYDTAGNKSNEVTFKAYMDTEAPSVTTVKYLGGDNTNKWKKDYKLELNASDDIGISYFEMYVNDTLFPESIYLNADNKFIYIPDNNFASDNVKFRAVDAAGNRGEFSSVQRIFMDTENPGEVSINFNGYAAGTWTNKDIVLKFNALDNVGIDHYEYSNDKVNTVSITDVFNIKTDQDTIYYFRAVDEAGNVGPWSNEVSIKRDTVNPTLTLGNIGVTTKSIAIPILESSDDRSGVKELSCVYGANTSYGTNGTIENGQCVLKGKDNKEYFYKITLVDNAGNIKEIANSAKTEEFGNISITPYNTDWYKLRQYSIKGSTPGTKLQYKIISTSDPNKNTDWIDIENDYKGYIDCYTNGLFSITKVHEHEIGFYATSTEPLYIMARLFDGENTSDSITYVETKLDKVKPKINVKNKIVTTNSVIQNYEIIDEHSGIDESKIQCKYGSDSANISGIYQDGACIFNNLKDNTVWEIFLNVYDYAGNQSGSSTSAVTNKFNEVLITPTTTDWGTSRTIKFSSDGDAQIQYKVVVMSDMSKNIDWTNIDNGGSITLNDLATTEAPTYVYARLNDGVNTSSEISYTEVALDPSTYNISYDLAGSTVSGNPSTFNVSNTFTLNNPTKNGYNFIGWTGSNGVNPEVTVKVNKGTRNDLSYTANFSLKNFDVSIVSNNSLVSSSNINVNYGGSNTFTLTPNTGYYLSGVSCTNGYTASAVLNSLDNQTITINNNNIDNSSTCTLTLTRVTASNLSYDNTNTGLSCTDAQCALDKIAEMLK